MIIPGMGRAVAAAVAAAIEDLSCSDRSPSGRSIRSSKNGDWLRRFSLTRSELLDLLHRTRFNVCGEIVVPAAGEALTIVPGKGVGGGDGLQARKSGWMFIWSCSFGGRLSFGSERCLVGLLVSAQDESAGEEVSMGDGRPGEGRIKRLSVERLASELLRCGMPLGEVGLVACCCCCCCCCDSDGGSS